VPSNWEISALHLRQAPGPVLYIRKSVRRNTSGASKTVTLAVPKLQCSKDLIFGGVAERLKAAVLKTVRPERVSWVRIPPPPPFILCTVRRHPLAEWLAWQLRNDNKAARTLPGANCGFCADLAGNVGRIT
jgi:hypothetical protein